LADTWFPTKEKVLAATIIYSINSFGSGLGSIVSPMIVTHYTKLHWYFIETAVFGSIISIMFFVGFREKPEYPPSPSAATPKQSSFFHNLKSLVKNVQFLMVFFIGSSITAAFYGYTAMFEGLGAIGGYSSVGACHMMSC
jgi:nitrate/nitrite transporter NarK